MGDNFKNISGSNIVNRSKVKSSFKDATKDLKDLSAKNQVDIQTLLFMYANPDNLDTLRFGEEIREIRTALTLSGNQESFQIKTAEAVIARDISFVLRENKADFVHISLHSSKSEGLLFQNDYGHKQAVSGKILADIFKRLKGENYRAKCIVLNACNSDDHAEGLKGLTDFSIGMKDFIPDRAAIEFTRSFYSMIFKGHDIKSSFEEAVGQIELAGIPKVRENAPMNQELPQIFY